MLGGCDDSYDWTNIVEIRMQFTKKKGNQKCGKTFQKSGEMSRDGYHCEKENRSVLSEVPKESVS